MSSTLGPAPVTQASGHTLSANDLCSSLRRALTITDQIIFSTRCKGFPRCPTWDSHRTDLSLLVELWDPPTKEELLRKLDETYSAVLSADRVTLDRLFTSLREAALGDSQRTLRSCTSADPASWRIDEAEQQLRAISLCVLERHDTLVEALNDELHLVARGAAFSESITETNRKSATVLAD
jgi:hypothetical protein